MRIRKEIKTGRAVKMGLWRETPLQEMDRMESIGTRHRAIIKIVYQKRIGSLVELTSKSFGQRMFLGCPFFLLSPPGLACTCQE